MIFASALLLAAATPPPPARVTVDRVAVTHVGRDPGAASGVFAFLVGFSGETRSGARDYQIFFMRIGQPKPRPGQTCDVEWRPWSGFSAITGDGRNVLSGRAVIRFRCDGGEWVWPGA